MKHKKVKIKNAENSETKKNKNKTIAGKGTY